MSATETHLTTPEQITAETKPGSIFEKGAPCSKCSGTGRILGFSHVANGVCFRCNGVGVPLTKRGAEARRYFMALSSTTVDGLSVGDRVYEQATPFSGAGWATVQRISDRTANPDEANSCSLYRASELEKIEAAVERGATVLPYEHEVDGEKYVAVYEGFDVKTSRCGHGGVSADHRFRVADPQTAVARMKAAAEYQLQLTKAGKPRKGSRYDLGAAA